MKKKKIKTEDDPTLDAAARGYIEHVEGEKSKKKVRKEAGIFARALKILFGRFDVEDDKPTEEKEKV